ncbi:ATP-binding protein [uncultured Sphaerochaeta sp.]|uniref:AAA family ATPase n=1 Tax=uncultured Sphaerochaeta sp. TaxID=886478 RepID=UPI002A0A6A6B|nr:ATP-binding protein [uncultured Sphaerochaeta sp.]
MLLTFSATNFKSFREPLVFEMKPAPKQKDLPYSILSTIIAGKEYQGLSTAVIYGPNASGKSNIIGAMHVLKMIVIRGHIRNMKEDNNPDPASNSLELIPNCCLKKPEPVNLSIDFTDSGYLFSYSISLDLGLFADYEYSRKIVQESLKVNGKLLYERKGNNAVHIETKEISDYTSQEYKPKQMEMLENLSKESLNDQELFLTNGFKTLYSPTLSSIISSWFEHRFLVYYRANSLESGKLLTDPNDQKVYINQFANTVAKAFGVNSSNLGYFAPKGETVAHLYSVFEENKKLIIPMENFESFGTVRFMNLFPILWEALQKGSTLVIDEFDASIHPMAVMSIINIFHNDEININKAQLIFNTQNPIFLNANLFRRDEIKFVERSTETKESIHYALSDFKTSGENGVRKGEDYLKNYFINKYGAISDIDLAPLFIERKQGNGKN